MKFSFEYVVGKSDETIEVTVSDALITYARHMGYDLISVENVIHEAMDRVVRTIQPSFWQDFTDTK